MAIAINKALGDEAVELGVLKALADNSFDSVLITDATKAGKIIYANKAFKVLTGYDPERDWKDPAHPSRSGNRQEGHLATGAGTQGREKF